MILSPSVNFLLPRGGGPDHPPVGTAWSKRAGRQLPVLAHTGLGHQWSWVQIPPAPPQLSLLFSDGEYLTMVSATQPELLGEKIDSLW